MRARLAYVVAAHLNPDLLLVDEVLAVGDFAYQRKCIGHMMRYLNAGGSLVFVSHNAFRFQTVCKRGIVLERGRLTFSGTSVEALNYYLETQSREVQSSSSSHARPVVPDDNDPIVIEDIKAEAADGDEIRSNEDLRLILKYRALESLDVIWGFSIWTDDQWVCVTGDYDMRPRKLSPGSGELRCLIPRNPLVAGSYWLKASIIDPASRRPLAMLGEQNPPQAFFVRSHPTELNNAFTAMNQLVTLDVKWQ
jgi:lipopolysaccharide transport system ATP-binding protein